MSFCGFIQANTQVVVIIGPFVDVGDGFTPETGVTLSGADEAELLKHNTSTTTSISAASWSAVTGCDGYYSLTLTTSHTDTEGLLSVMVNDDDVCLPVRCTFQVIAQAGWNSLIAAKDTNYMDVNVKTINDVSASGVTAVNANIGTSEQVNFQGSGATAYVKGDLRTIVGTAVSTTAAQLGVNSVQISGNSTAADNLESACTSTYNLGGGAIVAASVTGNISGNVNGEVGSIGSGGITAASFGSNAIASDALDSGAIAAIQSGLATTTELNKVPKSEGSTSWNSTALAAIKSEVDAAVADIPSSSNSATFNSTALASIEAEAYDALDLAIPVTPTADSINDYVKDQIVDNVFNEPYGTHNTAATFGAVVNDQAPPLLTLVVGTVDEGTEAATYQHFESSVNEPTANHYNGLTLKFITGSLAGQGCSITDYEYTGNNKGKFWVTDLTEDPTGGDTFVVL